jgi:hypothetical protein
MICAACEESIDSTLSPELERLHAHVQGRLGGQVRNLRLFLRGNGLVLQGRARTYYVKQLAQHMVMQAAEYPIQANEIEVV